MSAHNFWPINEKLVGNNFAKEIPISIYFDNRDH